MRSYTEKPEIHIKAKQLKSMRGGGFIDSECNDDLFTANIKLLIASTESELDFEMLADAFSELIQCLRQEATGGSLLSLYDKIPEVLKGRIELVYDLNNQPSFRLFEALFYKSKFNTSRLQSMRFENISSDARPFALSTPIFDKAGTLSICLPFKHTFYDRLFRARDVAIDEEEITSLFHMLENPAFSFEDFKLLFVPHIEHARPSRRSKSGVSIKYFGHATVLIESETTNILIDPVISYKYAGQSHRYTLADLPDRIDYVLITHSHLDHFLFESLIQLRHKIKHIIVPRSNEGSLQDPSLKGILCELGFTSIIQTSVLDEINFDDGVIKVLPFLGEHGDLDVTSKQAYCVNINDKNILFAADSNNIQPEMYQHIVEMIGPVDYIFIGMECEGAPMSWLYGALPLPHLTHAMDRSRRLDGSDCERAYQMINTLQCKNVFIYAMGGEPWLSFISSIVYEETSKAIIESNKLIARCRQEGLLIERLDHYKQIDLAMKS